MNNNFYDTFDLKYPEVAILLEDTHNGKGKFYIPVLMPLVDKDKPFDYTEPHVDTRNIKNNINRFEIERCNFCNYITLDLPNEEKEGKANDVFIIIFVGGDINKPRLIGRY